MKVLFLTNNQNTQPLVDWLRHDAKEEVIICNEKITTKTIEQAAPDFIISYNYNYLIKKAILDLLPGRVINLHISLLPYNRGANPNIWSFIKNTPKGVTIHLVDTDIDTGDILLQEDFFFEEDYETLSTSYRKLHDEIQRLFKGNWHKIKEFRITPKKQTERTSINYTQDFERIKNILGKDGWDIPIPELKKRYRELIGTINANSNLL